MLLHLRGREVGDEVFHLSRLLVDLRGYLYLVEVEHLEQRGGSGVELCHAGAGPGLNEAVQARVERVAPLVGGSALGHDLAGAELHVVAVLVGECCHTGSPCCHDALGCEAGGGGRRDVGLDECEVLRIRQVTLVKSVEFSHNL